MKDLHHIGWKCQVTSGVIENANTISSNYTVSTSYCNECRSDVDSEWCISHSSIRKCLDYCINIDEEIILCLVTINGDGSISGLAVGGISDTKAMAIKM